MEQALKTPTTEEPKQTTVNLSELSLAELQSFGFEAYQKREYLNSELENIFRVLNLINQELERRNKETNGSNPQ